MQKKEELINRIMEFNYRIFKMVNCLPATKLANTITNQIIRSSTSIGANYRAACRPKSRKDFINKMKLLAADQRGIIGNFFLIRCKQRGIDPNNPTPALPLEGEGTGGVMILKIVEEETDETLYWLEPIGGSKLIKNEKIVYLKKECSELLAIFQISPISPTSPTSPIINPGKLFRYRFYPSL